jgi:hypothetical protein
VLFTASGLCTPVSDLPGSCVSTPDAAYQDGIQFLYSGLNIGASAPVGSNLMLHKSFASCPYSPESSHPCWILMLYRISWGVLAGVCTTR